MTYDQLAVRLTALGASLHRHAASLSGPAAAKVARDLEKQVAKLEQLVAQAASRDTPEVRLVLDLLTDHAAVFPNARLADFAKRLGLKLPGAKTATPAALRAKFHEAVAAAGVAPAAVEVLGAFARAQAAPAPDLSSEPAQRATLRRLGAKSAEEIELELEAKFSDADVRTLARAAGLKVTAKAARKGLIPVVVHYARRHHENTSLTGGA